MQTQRLTIRPITPEDAAFLQELMSTINWHQFIGDRGVNSVETALAYMNERMHSDLEVKGFVNHVMIEKESGQPVGTCSLHDRMGVDGLDIGYALLSEFEGKGYASEGAKQMISLAFEKHQQSKVSAITTEKNQLSWRLLEKLGFAHQGFVKLPNSTEALKLYVMEKSEWISKASISLS